MPPNGWSEDSWRKDTTERLHRDSLWHLEGWQLNLLFSQDLAENEIRFRTERKRPEENSELEFIELKLKNSNSIVNFMLTMITMFYCEQYPKVPPNGWSEDSWRKDTTERLHRDSLWHLEGWQLNLMFFQDLAENEIRFRTTRKRPEENSESEFIELKLKNSNSIVNFMPTMITMFYCEQYPKVPPNGWSEDSWRKDTTERLHRDSLWHLEGWQLNLMFFQDLAENEIRFRTTRKRPEENSESEFIELKLKNSNSIVNFMLTMITMFYCEQYPKVPPNGWSEDSWRKDTVFRPPIWWHFRILLTVEHCDHCGHEIHNRVWVLELELNELRFWVLLWSFSCGSEPNFILRKILKEHEVQLPPFKMPQTVPMQPFCCVLAPAVFRPPIWWHFRILLTVEHCDHCEHEIHNRVWVLELELNELRFWVLLWSFSCGSEPNFILRKILKEHEVQLPPFKMPQTVPMQPFCCVLAPATERLHRDSLWHLEGWTTEVKDMSCSEKMVLDFQNTPVAFSSNRLPISLYSVFQQPLSQLRQFFQATTKYGWCRCEAVCGRPYLKNNLGEVLIKFHSTSKRIPDAPRLVCPLKSCSSVWNAIASSKFHGSAVRILKAVPQGVTKPLDLALRRDSMWHLEGWTTEVKDMSCSEKMVLDFQNTPVAFSSNRLPISLCSVFQQPLSNCGNFFKPPQNTGGADARQSVVDLTSKITWGRFW